MASKAGPEQRREWVLAALERYEAPLVRYARRLVADEEAARDIVQHAFLRLCDQSAEEIQDRVAPWLFAVCRNKAVDYLRWRQRCGTTSDCDLYPALSREPEPAARAERQDLYERLTQLMSVLPAGQREVLTLWAEGFGYREIAEIAGTSEGNVRVMMHRAIKRLRQHPLAQCLAEGWEPVEPSAASEVRT